MKKAVEWITYLVINEKYYPTPYMLTLESSVLRIPNIDKGDTYPTDRLLMIEIVAADDRYLESP